jgi:hypothetical protein
MLRRLFRFLASGNSAATVLATQRAALKAAARAGDKIRVRELAEQILAANPDEPTAQWNLAVLELQAGSLQRALELFAGLDRVRHGARTQTRVVQDARLAPPDAAAGVFVVGDALVDTTYWSVVDGDKLYWRETHGRTPENSPFIVGRRSPDASAYIFTEPPVSMTVGEPCVLLGSDANYSHWVLRNLLKLALLEGTPWQQAPLLIGEDLRSWQREFLELLGIAPERLIAVPHHALVRCRSLAVPTQLRGHPQLPLGLEWLRKRVGPLLAPQAQTRLFLSRRDTPLRRLVNEDEVLDALAPLGFERIVCGEMSIASQVRAFSGAAAIVAPHGAALTNLAFAAPGCAVVEIASRTIAHMGEFRSVGQALGLRMVTLLSDDFDLASRPSHELGMHRDYSIEPARVREAVTGLLA